MDSTPTSQPTLKKPNSNLNWAILVVILVVAIAGVIYVMTRNTSTSNSNTNANQNTNVAVNSNVNDAGNQNVNATNTNDSTNFNGNSNTSTVNFTKGGYDYTDKLENPYTNVTYYIRKATGEQYCGVNGSGTCDLVRAGLNDTFSVVANLFFKETPKTPGALQGASLLTFSDANTLIIKYASADHGGSWSSIYTYNLSSKALQQTIAFSKIETSNSGTYSVDYYLIEKGEKQLVFVNNPTESYTSAGVFTVVNSTVSKISTSLTNPFTVTFEVGNNYKDNRVSLLVNGTTVTFDFSKFQFE